MLGFVIAGISLFVLVRVLRRVGYLGRFAYGGFAGHRCYRGQGGFRGPRSWLRSVFERLGMTPAQEKVVARALEELRSDRAAIVEEARTVRADLASAVSSGLIDDSTLEEMFARHDRVLARLRVSFVEALKQVTEVLDERQRKQLAEILRDPTAGWWRDTYRGVWA